ncbi:MAG: 2-oxopent-4-enoate hydratase [Modestobacter sp.]|nr:2-oxopent-4-enoate hydratase [Modestobacter sp.]
MHRGATDRASQALQEAYAKGVPINPLTETFPGLSIDDAYDVQLAWVADQVRGGRAVRGHKVGLTSAVMQQQLGVDQPDFGHLLDGMIFSESDVVPMSDLIQPRIEPEIAFVLGEDLTGPGITVEDAARAVDYVVPALEVIDSRIVDWRITIADTIADNASSAAVVLGSSRYSLADVDLQHAKVSLTRNGEVVGTGTTGDVMGNPLHALVWLANTLGLRGQSLRAGHVVLPGSCTASVTVDLGDVVSASFDTAGDVTANFQS